MKILTTEQQRLLDVFTISNEPISSTDLMERAAEVCFQNLISKFDHTHNFIVFCGPGNNGGDGLVISRLLFLNGYSVKTFIVCNTDKYANDFLINETRLKEIGLNPIYITSNADLDIIIHYGDIIVDAIFGTGLSKPISGITEAVIKKINLSNATVISIDIPSGLFCEDNTINNLETIIKARHTLTFQAPKLSFLFPENFIFVGQWEVLDIGLDQNFINALGATNFFITTDFIKSIYKKRSKFSHKGTYGHALIIAGSKGKIGAALLAAKACLRAGSGLITAHVPFHAINIMQSAFPEAMLSIDSDENVFSEIPKLDFYSSIGVGPGLGTDKITANAFKQIIQNVKIPLVIDADGLNILAQNKTWLSFLPPNSILTPHPKEFERLFGKTENSLERLSLLKEMSFKFQIYIILKGAHTIIVSPNGNCFFNSTGNPGMATAGSGDVLTGIITGLFSQGYSSMQAAVFGVYLHGLAGDFAADSFSMEAMIASDITANLNKAFLIINDF